MWLPAAQSSRTPTNAMGWPGPIFLLQNLAWVSRKTLTWYSMSSWYFKLWRRVYSLYCQPLSYRFVYMRLVGVRCVFYVSNCRRQFLFHSLTRTITVPFFLQSKERAHFKKYLDHIFKAKRALCSTMNLDGTQVNVNKITKKLYYVEGSELYRVC